MTRKKILFLIESLSGGGAEKVLTVLLKHFDHAKYEVTVCPIVDTGVYCDEVRSYVAHYMPVVSYHGNALSRLFNRIKYKFIYSFFPLSQVYRWFIPKGYDVEIAFCEGYVTKLLSYSNSQAKKISWVHTDLIHNPWPIKQRIFRNTNEERDAYSHYQHIVCVSHTVEISFQRKYGLHDRTTTIYNPIDIADIQEKSTMKSCTKDKNVFHLISIGRLVQQKGYDRLLRVVKRLHDDGHAIRLTILGEGEERVVLEQFISVNQMQGYVSLPGFAKNPYPQLAAADLFVCSSRAEGFSLVIAEAMALGTPVISTYCSGPNELLGEGKYGILVENSEEALSDELSHIIATSNELHFFATLAQSQIRQFAVTNIMKKIGELIN